MRILLQVVMLVKLRIYLSSLRMYFSNKMHVPYRFQIIASNWSSLLLPIMHRKYTMMISPCKSIFSCLKRSFLNVIAFFHREAVWL